MTKRLLLTTAALGAIGSAAMVQAETYDWSGGYAGLSFDYGSYGHGSETDLYAHFGADLHESFTGQLGYNFQNGGFVYGIEALITPGTQQGRFEYTDSIAPTGNHGSQYTWNWAATLRARAGVTTGNVLFYGALGATHADVELFICDRDFGPDCDADNDSYIFSGGITGYSAAIGTEFLLSERLSGFLEFNRTYFPHIFTSDLRDGSTASWDGEMSLERDQIRFGFNYSFAPRNELADVQTTQAIWNGFYAGALLTGAKIVDDSTNYDTGYRGGETDVAYTGLLGRNWQIGNTVLGLEADLTSRLESVRAGYDAENTTEFNLDWTATLRGRAGITSGNALVYTTAGLAVSGADLKGCEGSFGVRDCDTTSASAIENFDDTLFGFTAGLGIEYALSSASKLRAEYLYISYPHTGDYDTFVYYPSGSLNLIRLGYVHQFGNDAAAPSAKLADWAGTYGGVYTSLFNVGTSGGSEEGYHGLANNHSFTLGAKFGQNWQRGRFVFGLGLDVQSGTEDTVVESLDSGSQTLHTASWDWTASLIARAGIATGDLLLYTSGGLTASDVTLRSCENFQTQTCFNGTNTSVESTVDDVLFGFNAGFGAEYKIRDNVSVFTEYQMIQFGTQRGVSNQTDRFTDHYTWSHQLKFGVNYHFQTR